MEGWHSEVPKKEHCYPPSTLHQALSELASASLYKLYNSYVLECAHPKRWQSLKKKAMTTFVTVRYEEVKNATAMIKCSFPAVLGEFFLGAKSPRRSELDTGFGNSASLSTVCHRLGSTWCHLTLPANADRILPLNLPLIPCCQRR